LGTKCDKHAHCDEQSEFCSAVTKHKNQCVSCNFCNRGKDSIDGSCPERCIPPLGAPCDASHPCDPLSEFCHKVTATTSLCHSCVFCRGKTAFGSCPAHCTTPIGSACDGHHHCDSKSEFCSKVAAGPLWGNHHHRGEESVKHKCAPCNECKANKQSVDGVCPKHCIPPIGAPCGAHLACSSNEFCAKIGIAEEAKHRCAPCNFCTNGRVDSADGGKCPSHCVPPLGPCVMRRTDATPRRNSAPPAMSLAFRQTLALPATFAPRMPTLLGGDAPPIA
jgi:hypothetical protein